VPAPFSTVRAVRSLTTIDDTSLGRIGVTWGVNDWVMIDARGETIQRRVASRHEFASVLESLGLSQAEAEAHAEALWHARPRDAATESARPNEAAWRATGTPTWVLALVLLAVLAVAGVAFYLYSAHR
jgi:hypothetical protein